MRKPALQRFPIPFLNSKSLNQFQINIQGFERTASRVQLSRGHWTLELRFNFLCVWQVERKGQIARFSSFYLSLYIFHLFCMHGFLLFRLLLLFCLFQKIIIHMHVCQFKGLPYAIYCFLTSWSSRGNSVSPCLSFFSVPVAIMFLTKEILYTQSQRKRVTSVCIVVLSSFLHSCTIHDPLHTDGDPYSRQIFSSK